MKAKHLHETLLTIRFYFVSFPATNKFLPSFSSFSRIDELLACFAIAQNQLNKFPFSYKLLFLCPFPKIPLKWLERMCACVCVDCWFRKKHINKQTCFYLPISRAFLNNSKRLRVRLVFSYHFQCYYYYIMFIIITIYYYSLL